MNRFEELKAAVMREFHDEQIASNKPVNFLLIGPPLVSKGYGEQEIANAIIALSDEKVIKMIPGNRAVLGEKG